MILNFHIRQDQIEWKDYLISYQSKGKEEFKNFINDHSLPNEVFTRVISSDQLPAYQVLDSAHLLILRIPEIKSKSNSLTIQNLTTKMTILTRKTSGGVQIFTFHRTEIAKLNEFKDRNLEDSIKEIYKTNKIEINSEVIESVIFYILLDDYSLKLDQQKNDLYNFEEKILKHSEEENLIQEGFKGKQRLNSFKKILQNHLTLLKNENLKLFNKNILIEKIEKSLFYAEESSDNLNQLLSLHLTIASHKTNEASFKTNEIMRVLTVISLFFLPLNFIVGLYGMNFENMPELKWNFGYPMILVIMTIVISLIYKWTSSKGWLKSND